MTHLTLEEIKDLGQTPKKRIAHRLGFVYRRVSPYFSYIIINYTTIGANFFSALAIASYRNDQDMASIYRYYKIMDGLKMDFFREIINDDVNVSKKICMAQIIRHFRPRAL